jgi:invasion protein IalB
MNISADSALLCEIHAPRAAQAAALAEIAASVARDLGQPLAVKTLALGSVACGARRHEPALTLHLPAALASTQHQAWCLACRLACFCPDARVSVLVQGADFAGPAASPEQLAG